jgi:hypothetical protein
MNKLKNMLRTVMINIKLFFEKTGAFSRARVPEIAPNLYNEKTLSYTVFNTYV